MPEVLERTGATQVGSYEQEDTTIFDDGLLSTEWSHASAWEDIEDQISALHELEDDWDGDGADAPDQGLIESASRFIYHLKHFLGAIPPDRVCSSPDGSVCLEWDTGSGILELELATCGPSAMWYNPETGECKHLSLPHSSR